MVKGTKHSEKTKKKISKSRFIDLIGKKFGKWAVLNYAGKYKWLCRCECGLVSKVCGASLRNGSSTQCHSCAQTGKKHTEETKRKISLGNKGKIISEEARIKTSITLTGVPLSKERCKNISEGHKGIKFTEEHRKNMSLAADSELISKNSLKMWAKPGFRENHPLWQGGKSFEPYGQEFNNKLKLQIRKRDNFTCQECRYTEEQLGYALSVHHIDYNKKNNKPDNLIALCKSCHSQTNFNRKDWSEYFKEKLIGAI